VDITSEYEILALDPGERVWEVTYVNEYGRIVEHHVSYSPRRDFSPHPKMRTLQEECLKLTKSPLRRWLRELELIVIQLRRWAVRGLKRLLYSKFGIRGKLRWPCA
jgi:hypothetical protein